MSQFSRRVGIIKSLSRLYVVHASLTQVYVRNFPEAFLLGGQKCFLLNSPHPCVRINDLCKYKLTLFNDGKCSNLE
jgi:hypothetical protein